MTVITSILQSIRNAASYNKHELAAPRVILWPDEERLWTQCIELLRESYPALWSLGDYSPESGAWIGEVENRAATYSDSVFEINYRSGQIRTLA